MSSSNGQTGAFVRSPARDALVDGFNALVLDTGYDGMTVGDIIARAGVGRSTFYEHFANKEELLGECMAPILRMLVCSVSPRPDVDSVAWVVRHIAQQRTMALALFTSKSYDVIAELYRELVERELDSRHGLFIVRPAILSHYLAHGQLNVIAAWLQEAMKTPDERIARSLIDAAQASVKAWRT